MAAALDRRVDLVDHLVLLLDVETQAVALGQHLPGGREEHGLLGECVREDEAAELREDFVLLLAVGRADPLDKRVELLALTPLAHDDAARAAELSNALVRDGSKR